MHLRGKQRSQLQAQSGQLVLAIRQQLGVIRHEVVVDEPSCGLFWAVQNVFVLIGGQGYHGVHKRNAYVVFGSGGRW